MYFVFQVFGGGVFSKKVLEDKNKIYFKALQQLHHNLEIPQHPIGGQQLQVDVLVQNHISTFVLDILLLSPVLLPIQQQ